MGRIKYCACCMEEVSFHTVERNERLEISCSQCGFLLEIKPLWQEGKRSNVGMPEIAGNVFRNRLANRDFVKKVVPNKHRVNFTTGYENKRSFKRYHREGEVIVKLDTAVYKGKIIDYSDGICAIIEDAPPLVPRTMVDIKSRDAKIEILGEVVWTKKLVSGLRIGVKRVDNLRGSLKDFSPVDILFGLQRNKNTGILEINNGPILKKIYVKDGDIIFAASSRADDRLADVLLNAGKITVEQYNKSVEMLNKTEKSQSTILVELGYLSPQELIRALKHQVEMIVMSLFNSEDGNFELQEGPLPAKEAITLTIGTTNLIYQGIKKINDFQNIKQECPPMDAVLCLSKEPTGLSRDILLDDTDKTILSHINGKNSIRDILSLSLLSDLELLRTIYALLITGVIKVKGETPIESSTEDASVEAEIGVDTKLMEKIEDMYNKYETLGYYGILGINVRTSEKEIKEAYYRTAEQFHPDRYFSLPSDINKKLNTLFSYITQAYETLSDPAKRREYDRSPSTNSAKPAPNNKTAKTMFNQGRAEMMMRNFSEAAHLFAQAIYFDSSAANYHYYHGLALIKQGMFKEAAKAVGNAINLNPQKADYIAMLGHIFLNLGFKTRAKNTFERALKLSHSNEKAIEGMKKLGNDKKSLFEGPEIILQKIAEKYHIKRRSR